MSESLARFLAALMVREQVDVAGLGMFGALEAAESMLASDEGRVLAEVFAAAMEEDEPSGRLRAARVAYDGIGVRLVEVQ